MASLDKSQLTEYVYSLSKRNAATHLGIGYHRFQAEIGRLGIVKWPVRHMTYLIALREQIRELKPSLMSECGRIEHTKLTEEISRLISDIVEGQSYKRLPMRTRRAVVSMCERYHYDRQTQTQLSASQSAIQQVVRKQPSDPTGPKPIEPDHGSVRARVEEIATPLPRISLRPRHIPWTPMDAAEFLEQLRAGKSQ